MKYEKHLRVLVAGLGSIGRRHARLLSERDDVELWLCDIKPRFIEETRSALVRPAAKAFAKYATALDAEPDVVFVCTPTSLHAAMGLQALEAGCNLFVEKPVCSDLESARSLVDAADATRRLLQVGYMLRFEDGLMRVQSLVAEGTIGEIVGARAMIGTHITLLNARDSDRERQPYSLLLDYSHEFDFVNWILGDVHTVCAMSARLGRLPLRPDPNVFQAVLGMRSGALVQVHLDYVQHPQRRIFEIYGDRGTLVYDFMSGVLQTIPFGAPDERQMIELGPIASRVDDVYRRQIDHLLRACRDHSRPLVGGDEALAALAVVEAAIESIETKRRVVVQLPTSRDRDVLTDLMAGRLNA